VIKLKGSKKHGYLIGMTNWFVGWEGSGEYQTIALTEQELKALYKLLKRKFDKLT